MIGPGLVGGAAKVDPMTSVAADADTGLDLGYDAFGSWYDRHRADVLLPALAAASQAIEALLDEQLSERDRGRIRAITGRVKSKRRTWRKLRQPRNRDRIGSVDDIPAVIDDLVGARITCVNLRDIDLVQDALDSLPRRRTGGARLWVDAASERDYVVEPKESGYRGWHVNLGVSVDVDGQLRPVTCELQVRTLLQDSWGELTHADTYSKDGALPPLVEVLSKRMADLLATLDDIAEDLRTELDRIDDAVVTETTAVEIDVTVETPGDGEQANDATELLRQRWSELDRPVDLATLAWELQREFGAEVSDGWFGHRTFKQFLRNALDGAEISTGRQAYLLPRAPEPEPAEVPESLEPYPPAERSSVPAAARQMRRIDGRFPLLETDEWWQLYGHLAEAWATLGPQKASNRALHRLTRAARDRAVAHGDEWSRRHLDYLARTVLPAGDDAAPLTVDAIADAFAAATVQRMTDLRVLDPQHQRARNAVIRWLTRPT